MERQHSSTPALRRELPSGGAASVEAGKIFSQLAGNIAAPRAPYLIVTRSARQCERFTRDGAPFHACRALFYRSGAALFTKGECDAWGNTICNPGLNHPTAAAGQRISADLVTPRTTFAIVPVLPAETSPAPVCFIRLRQKGTAEMSTSKRIVIATGLIVASLIVASTLLAD
ncbi:MAG TPA: hypothetical protein VJ464_25330 [Blastocatellia bacterium]|nr:hypothetical protein [Blastocatellia bacterium]